MLGCPMKGLIVVDSLHLALVEGGQGILQRTLGLSQGKGYTNVPQSCGGNDSTGWLSDFFSNVFPLKVQQLLFWSHIPSGVCLRYFYTVSILLANTCEPSFHDIRSLLAPGLPGGTIWQNPPGPSLPIPPDL